MKVLEKNEVPETYFVPAKQSLILQTLNLQTTRGQFLKTVCLWRI